MAEGAVRPRRREHPACRSRHAVQDRAGGGRQPDRSRPGLAVGQEQLTLAPVAPLQRANLARTTPGQQQQPDNGDLLRTVGLEAVEYRRQAAYLRRRQEPFAPLAPVSLDALARVAAFRAIAVDFGLAHDDGQDRSGPVCRCGLRVERGEPLPHVAAVDAGDRAALEARQDMVAVVVPVDLESSGLPVSRVAREDLVGNGLEHGFFGRCGRVAASPDRGEHRRGPRAGFADARALGAGDGLPDTPALVLAVDKVAFLARRPDTQTKTFQVPVTHVVGGFAGFQCIDPALVEFDGRHGLCPPEQLQAGQEGFWNSPGPAVVGEKSNAISVL